MSERTTTSIPQRKVDDGAAMAALSKLSAKLSSMKRATREAAEAERVAKREAKKAGILAMLNTGTPIAKSDVWCARFALKKAVTAVKLGSTAEELLACAALQAVAPWGDLKEAVAEYALAKCADVAVVLAGLGCTEDAPAVPAEAPTMATPETAPDSPHDVASEPEQPRARNARKARPRGRKGA